MRKLIILSMLVVLIAVPGLFANGQQDSGSSGSSDSAVAKYPSKPIQVVVPAGAGGDTDGNSRILAKYLEKELGTSVVVVNVGGAGGTLGSRKVKDSAPDGYTVLFFHPSMLLNKLMGMVDYTARDFENAGLAVLDQTNVFVANAEAPFNNMKDVQKILQENPRSLKFATEAGAFTHLQVLAYSDAADVELNIVDIGGAAKKTAALLGNQIDIIGTQYGLIKDYVAKGQFKALGVLSEERNPSFPDVPTFMEQGFDIAFSKFFFYSFPPGTPEGIVTKFTQALERVVNNPEYVKEANSKLLVDPTYMPPDKAIEFINKQEDIFNSYKEMILSAK